MKFATIHDESNLVALIGANKGAPRRPEISKFDTVLWDNNLEFPVAKVSDAPNFALRVLVSQTFFVPICEEGLGIFEVPNRKKFTKDSLLASYGTVSNPHALGVLGTRLLVFPGMSKGNVQIVNLASMKSYIINTHSSNLRAIALSADEELLATTSERGTLVRVWSTSSQSKVAEFRRGLEESAIYSLAFSPNNALLALTSGNGTVHIFRLSQWSTSETSVISEHDHRVSGGPRKVSNFSRSNTSKRTSIEPQRIHGLSFSPVVKEQDKEVMPHLGTLSHTNPSSEDPGVPNWSYVSQAAHNKKSAHFQDEKRSALHGGQSDDDDPEHKYFTYSTTPFVEHANKAKKWGSLANLPFAPRVLKDEYSVCSTSFTHPGRKIETSALDESALYIPPPSIPPPAFGSSSTSTHRRLPSAPQGKTLTQGLARPSSLAQGAAPNGQIAWTRNLELVVVSASRGGRWEKFRIQEGTADGRSWSIVCETWKPYLCEEGRKGYP